jgi:hypothetical protein
VDQKISTRDSPPVIGPFYIWSVDLNFRLVTFNQALSSAFARGIGAKIAAGMTPLDLLPPEKAAFSPPISEKALGEGLSLDRIKSARFSSGS